MKILLLKNGASEEVKKDGYNISKIADIEKWLVSKNVLPENAQLESFIDVQSWSRGGAETYIAIFSIEYLFNKEIFERKLVVKALVAMNSEKRLKDWKTRRELLKNAGVPVSYWYYSGEGIIIEDYYKESVSKKTNFASLKNIALKLDELGFKPLDFLRDVRVNNKNKPYYIDFGFDLGEPQSQNEQIAEDQYNKFLKKHIMELVKNIVAGVKKAQNNNLRIEQIYKSSAESYKKNEFLFFIKPEITVNDENIKLTDIVELILSKIKEFDFDISNVKVLSSKYLDEHNIIAHHYGVINRIANNAKEGLSDGAKEKFESLYGEKLDSVDMLGGFQFLKEHKDFTPLTLDYLCQNQKSEKLAGGTYCIDIKLDAKKVFLVNGFHPRQLNEFTADGRSIVVFTLKSDIDWGVARSNFIGATNPINAEIGSIRRSLLENKQELGLKEVSQGLNGVHLSAGPLEGLVELIRYNKDFDITDDSINYKDFVFGKKLSKLFNEKEIYSIMNNCDVKIDGKKVSLFDLTEEINSEQALETIKENI